jgi:hypothetical protein
MLSDVLIRSVKRTTRPRKLSDTGRLHLPERVNDFETPGCLRLESNSATHFDFPNLVHTLLARYGIWSPYGNGW